MHPPPSEDCRHRIDSQPYAFLPAPPARGEPRKRLAAGWVTDSAAASPPVLPGAATGLSKPLTGRLTAREALAQSGRLDGRMLVLWIPHAGEAAQSRSLDRGRRAWTRRSRRPQAR